MKISIIDDSIIVFLNKNLCVVDYNDAALLENLLRKLFDRLNTYYKIEIKGYYDANIYLDKYYGSVIELINDRIDYYDTTEVDMRIKIVDTNILYKVDDIPHLDSQYQAYLYRGDIYVVLDEASVKDIMILTELSDIVYKNTKSIINAGRVLKM